MSEIKDGGQAFPHGDPTHGGDIGMTLRDYFAAKALIAVTQGDHVDGMGDPFRHAARAYEYAAAMLKARGAQ